MPFKVYNIVVLSLALGVFSMVSLVNIVVDPGSIYLKKYLRRSEFDLYASTLISTKYGMLAGDWNERSVKLALAKIAGRFDCVILGSSHVMNVSSFRRPSAVDGFCETLMNLGVSGGGLEDLVIFIYTMGSEHQMPRRVLIGVDPWTLNFESDARWREQEDVYKKGLEAFKIDDRQLRESYWTKITANLLNLDYFVQSWRLMRQEGARTIIRGHISSVRANRSASVDRLTPITVPAEFDYSAGLSSDVILPDGSDVYSSAFLAKVKARQTLMDDQGYKIPTGPAYDEAATALLVRMTDYLREMGVDVYFVLTPYHPNVWKAPTTSTRVMNTVSAEVRRLGRANGITTVGSYNPADIGCTADEYFDFMHPQPSCLKKTFARRD